jgi:hypothetical protein
MQSNLKTDYHTTPNGAHFTGKSYERPGFHVGVVVGDPESFFINADGLMTFYPNEVREMAAALAELAGWMEERGYGCPNREGGKHDFAAVNGIYAPWLCLSCGSSR